MRIASLCMRTRTLYTTYPGSSASSLAYKNTAGNWTNRTKAVTIFTQPFTYVNFVEYSSDLGDGKTFTSWNPFEHYSAQVVPLANSAVVWSYKNLASYTTRDRYDVTHPLWMWKDSVYGPLPAPVNGLVKLYDPALPGHFVWSIGGEDLAQLQAKSLQAMLPTVRPELSLLNSIIELKDFKRLPSTIRRVMKLKSFLTQLAINAGKVGRDAYSRWLGRKTLRRALNSTSDGYLTHQFAIAPLLRDITDLQDALKGVDKQFRSLLAVEGRKLRRHYNAILGPGVGLVPVEEESGLIGFNTGYAPYSSLSNVAGGPYSWPYMLGHRMTRTVSYPVAKFHAELECTYYLSRYQRERGYVLTLLDALGVNLNPAIIWNAIPWSFVVDWVFGVSKWLDQFKIQHMEPTTIIHRYLWSTSVVRVLTFRRKSEDFPAFQSPDRVGIVQVTERAYRRDRGIPNFTTMIESSGFSLKEFSLASALLLGKRTR